MPEYDRELTGVLFRNDKGDNDKRPDYRGTCQVQIGRASCRERV